MVATVLDERPTVVGGTVAAMVGWDRLALMLTVGAGR